MAKAKKKPTVIARDTHILCPNPPGYTSPLDLALDAKLAADPEIDDTVLADLKTRHAWDIGLSPIKSLPMQAIMLYMSGSSVQVFSISIVFMLMFNSIKGMLAVQSTFSSLGDQQAYLPQKTLWILSHLLGLGLGIYKSDSMAIFPSRPGDWVEFMPRPTSTL